MHPRPHLESICLSLMCLWALCSWPHEVMAADHNDSQVRRAIEQAAEITIPNAARDQIRTRSRADLDWDLSNIAAQTAANVAFYDMESSTVPASDGNSIWAVVSGNSAQQSYSLFRFDSTEGLEQSSEEFNRLVSKLALSVQGEKAVDLAGFFIECCVRDSPGEIVTDEDHLRHAVERYYLGAFGDVWRTLEAYTQWWQNYEKSLHPSTSTFLVKDGVSRVIVTKLLLIPGTHPQLQQWNVEVSRDGSVHVLAVRAIYPRQSHWLYYDFRSTSAPQTH